MQIKAQEGNGVLKEKCEGEEYSLKHYLRDNQEKKQSQG